MRLIIEVKMVITLGGLREAARMLVILFLGLGAGCLGVFRL